MSPQRRRLLALNSAFLLGFGLVALALVVWVLRAPALLAREDNPRLVEAELRVQRGRILDNSGVVLAENAGTPDRVARRYPIADIGPAVGYYSLRHGTAGIEQGLDNELRGQRDDLAATFARQVLHRPQIGRDVRLTLNATWQERANELLGSQRGAVVLLSLSDQAVRVMASHPGYDPNRLDDTFEALMASQDAPLLNRATQGQYQPGLALQPLILAEAVARGLVRLDQPATDANKVVVVDGQALGCLKPPPEGATLAEALQGTCPAPMMALAGPFGVAGLQELFARMGLFSAPALPLGTDVPQSEPVQQAGLGIIGQENLTVTPLQMALAWAALAGGGTLLPPRLVEAVADDAGNWQARLAPATPQALFPPSAARAVLQALPRLRDIAEHSALALTGPSGGRNAWYLGLAPASSPQIAVVVILEATPEVAPAQQIGRALLATAFSAPDS